VGAVISQRDPEDGVLHPITFHSRKFSAAEMNYEIYDKEMLAIVETMDRYRHYFEGLGQQTIIFSDHRNLLWFTETKVYNRRQARWARSCLVLTSRLFSDLENKVESPMHYPDDQTIPSAKIPRDAESLS
jgi:hypothetical protein